MIIKKKMVVTYVIDVEVDTEMFNVEQVFQFKNGIPHETYEDIANDILRGKKYPQPDYLRCKPIGEDSDWIAGSYAFEKFIHVQD